MTRVLMASPDQELVTRANALFVEAGDVEVVATASTASEITGTLSADGAHLDVVVLHEALGPLPVLDLARDLNHRFPQVGVVLLARDPSMELMRSAMSAGIRSVVRLPLTLSELHGAILEANEWSQTVQARLTAAGDQVSRQRLIDLGKGRNRLGGSALAQVYGSVGEHAPDVDPAQLKATDPKRTVAVVSRCGRAGGAYELTPRPPPDTPPEATG